MEGRRPDREKRKDSLEHRVEDLRTAKHRDLAQRVIDERPSRTVRVHRLERIAKRHRVSRRLDERRERVLDPER